MYKYNIKHVQSRMKRVHIEGEPIEIKIERMMTTKEPIPGEAPIIHMERKEGVNAAYNPRTDRFDIAIDAMDLASKSKVAKREERAKALETKGDATPSVDSTKPSDTPAA